MPEVTLSDIQRVLVPTELTEMRLQALSFFALGLLIFAAFIRWIWNALRKDFPVLPRLSYFRASGLVFLWGLLFVLILTMISGARELLTPGAWEKVPGGVTYRLVNPTEPTLVERQITDRCVAIGRLADALRTFRGQYPETAEKSGIRDELWIVPGIDGARYIYLGDPAKHGGLIACEPESLGSDRLAINGDVVPIWVTAFDIEQAIRAGEGQGKTHGAAQP